ncbi:hypothetical protein KIW84_051617 [Lathyrus oleraceus]|uniref:Ribosome-recycling factor, chloroplastic n=1 Tax=Pisum sativum TaxID=3888 RepID=A0A9D4WMV5_PEA|nr:hypothetical protein KIW84_051617 [Pisum sativum]
MFGSPQQKLQQQHVFVSGWMHVNEHGQMCGPYIKEQLYEGLTSGFLPFEPPVYPVINGTITNPVPLNYFQQYPDHVSTRFAYMGMNFSDTTMSTNGSSSRDMTIYGQDRSFEPAALMAVNTNSKSVSQSNVNDCTKESNHLNLNSEAFRRIISCRMSGGECCWLYEDNKVISHFDNKYGSFVLLAAVNALKGDISGTICGSDSKSNGVGDDQTQKSKDEGGVSAVEVSPNVGPTIKASAASQMESDMAALSVELSKLRTGRASAGMLDHIIVETGENVTVSSPLGLNPKTDGERLIAVIPPFSKEHVQAMNKLVIKSCEDTRQSIRGARQKNLKEERKGKAQELEDSNKRARLLEDQKDDLDHILLGSTSVIRTRKEELKKAEYRICELGRLLDKSLMDKKEIKLDFEAQICDLRDALKKCEEKLFREILQKEEAERNCHHLRTA